MGGRDQRTREFEGSLTYIASLGYIVGPCLKIITIATIAITSIQNPRKQKKGEKVEATL